MSETNPLIRFPLEVQEEVEKLRCNKQNALMITKIIESKYTQMLVESGHPVPTFNDINKYVKWAKKNRGAVIKSDYSSVDAVIDDMDNDMANNLTEDVLVNDRPTLSSDSEDAVLQTGIELSTPKNTLEDVKKRLQLSIQRLEKRRVTLGDEYNDKLEANLRGYYVELSRLTHTEVKMAEELRDSDKIDVATINFILNKLFQSVAAAINEVDITKRALFFSVRKNKVMETKNQVLGDIIKEIGN